MTKIIIPEKTQIQSAQNKKSRAEGKAFEEMILAACRIYSREGIAEIAKNEEARQVIGRTGDRKSKMICINAKKALPDFAGTLCGGQSIFIEAKYTEKDRIDYERVTEHQRELLEKHEKLGALCYVLVCFGFRRFYRFPYSVWREMRQLFGRKYISASDNISEFEVPENGGFLRFLEGVRHE